MSTVFQKTHRPARNNIAAAVWQS